MADGWDDYINESENSGNWNQQASLSFGGNDSSSRADNNRTSKENNDQRYGDSNRSNHSKGYNSNQNSRGNDFNQGSRGNNTFNQGSKGNDFHQGIRGNNNSNQGSRRNNFGQNLKGNDFHQGSRENNNSNQGFKGNNNSNQGSRWNNFGRNSKGNDSHHGSRGNNSMQASNNSYNKSSFEQNRNKDRNDNRNRDSYDNRNRDRKNSGSISNDGSNYGNSEHYKNKSNTEKFEEPPKLVENIPSKAKIIDSKQQSSGSSFDLGMLNISATESKTESVTSIDQHTLEMKILNLSYEFKTTLHSIDIMPSTHVRKEIKSLCYFIDGIFEKWKCSNDKMRKKDDTDDSDTSDDSDSSDDYKRKNHSKGKKRRERKKKNNNQNSKSDIKSDKNVEKHSEKSNVIDCPIDNNDGSNNHEDTSVELNTIVDNNETINKTESSQFKNNENREGQSKNVSTEVSNLKYNENVKLSLLRLLRELMLQLNNEEKILIKENSVDVQEIIKCKEGKYLLENIEMELLCQGNVSIENICKDLMKYAKSAIVINKDYKQEWQKVMFILSEIIQQRKLYLKKKEQDLQKTISAEVVKTEVKEINKSKANTHEKIIQHLNVNEIVMDKINKSKANTCEKIIQHLNVDEIVMDRKEIEFILRELKNISTINDPEQFIEQLITTDIKAITECIVLLMQNESLAMDFKSDTLALFENYLLTVSDKNVVNDMINTFKMALEKQKTFLVPNDEYIKRYKNMSENFEIESDSGIELDLTNFKDNALTCLTQINSNRKEKIEDILDGDEYDADDGTNNKEESDDDESKDENEKKPNKNEESEDEEEEEEEDDKEQLDDNNGEKSRAPLSKLNESLSLFCEEYIKSFELIDSQVEYLLSKYESTQVRSSEWKQSENNVMYQIKDTITMVYPKCRVHIFGSRGSGLSLPDSDLDVYVDISGDSYWSGISYDAQRSCVSRLNNQFRRNQNFSHTMALRKTKVPILKLYHIKTSINCDISFKNGIGVENTQLLQYYLNFDSNVKWLITAVKLWAIYNGLCGSSFTSHALSWLVLFYLMQENVVPPIIQLRKNCSPKYIDNWNVAFTPIIDSGIIFEKKTKKYLFENFFHFILQSDLDSKLLCTLTGEMISKKSFNDLEWLKLYYNGIFETWIDRIQVHYQSKINTYRNPSASQLITKIEKSLCIQDPFEFSKNISSTVENVKYDGFINLCRYTHEKLVKLNC